MTIVMSEESGIAFGTFRFYQQHELDPDIGHQEKNYQTWKATLLISQWEPGYMRLNYIGSV